MSINLRPYSCHAISEFPVLRSMDSRSVRLDPDGLFVEPKLVRATLFGVVLEPSNTLRLFLETSSGKRIQISVPKVNRMFLSPDLTTGTGFEPRTELFEVIYSPVTEETVISVVENIEMMGAQVDGIDRIVRSAGYALEWITVKGSNGLALSEASPDELFWHAEL